MILREVLASILTKDYRDRVPPFINILLEYLEAPVKEKRMVLPPRSARPIRPVRPVRPVPRR